MNVADYVSKKVAVSELALETARQMTDKGVIVELNSADDISRSSLYLTVTGTSAEAGDDGEVGRGNRVNGMITPYRPMNMKAAAGKNPITHVGKLYNIAAKQVAQTAVEELPEINEIYCYLVSRIGHPINEPHLVDIHVRLREDVTLETIKPRLADIAHDKLMAMDRIRDGLVAATIPVY